MQTNKMLRNIKDKINCCGGNSPARLSHRRANSGKFAPKKRPLFQKKDEQDPVEKSIFDDDIKIWGEYNYEFKFKVQG